MPYAGSDTHFYEVAAYTGVVCIIFERVTHRIRSDHASSEVDYSLNVVFFDYELNEPLVASVTFYKCQALRHCLPEPACQVVDHNWPVAIILKGKGRMTPNVSGTSYARKLVIIPLSH